MDSAQARPDTAPDGIAPVIERSPAAAAPTSTGRRPPRRAQAEATPNASASPYRVTFGCTYDSSSAR